MKNKETQPQRNEHINSMLNTPASFRLTRSERELYTLYQQEASKNRHFTKSLVATPQRGIVELNQSNQFLNSEVIMPLCLVQHYFSASRKYEIFHQMLPFLTDSSYDANHDLRQKTESKALCCASNLILYSTPTCPAVALPNEVSGGSLVSPGPS